VARVVLGERGKLDDRLEVPIDADVGGAPGLEVDVGSPYLDQVLEVLVDALHGTLRTRLDDITDIGEDVYLLERRTTASGDAVAPSTRSSLAHPVAHGPHTTITPR
jgi:hypothetical protein